LSVGAETADRNSRSLATASMLAKIAFRCRRSSLPRPGR
jgi:hypothetical protein